MFARTRRWRAGLNRRAPARPGTARASAATGARGTDRAHASECRVPRPGEPRGSPRGVGADTGRIERRLLGVATESRALAEPQAPLGTVAGGLTVHTVSVSARTRTLTGAYSTRCAGAARRTGGTAGPGRRRGPWSMAWSPHGRTPPGGRRHARGAPGRAYRDRSIRWNLNARRMRDHNHDHHARACTRVITKPARAVNVKNRLTSYGLGHGRISRARRTAHVHALELAKGKQLRPCMAGRPGHPHHSPPQRARGRPPGPRRAARRAPCHNAARSLLQALEQLADGRPVC